MTTVAATITGGWDRGDGDTGSFGVVLHFSSRPERPPEPGPNEIRLRTGGTVSVSNEEHYQSTLLAVTQGLDVRGRKYPVAAALRLVEANPHVKKSTGPVLEVRIGVVLLQCGDKIASVVRFCGPELLGNVAHKDTTRDQRALQVSRRRG